MHAFGMCLLQKHYHYYTNPASVSQCVTKKYQISPIGVHITNIQGHRLQVTPYIVHTKYRSCSK